MGGGSRDLYYYPKDTVLVTAMSPKLKKGLHNQSEVSCSCLANIHMQRLSVALPVSLQHILVQACS